MSHTPEHPPSENAAVCPKCGSNQIASFSTIYDEVPRIYKLGASIFSSAGAALPEPGPINSAELSERTAPPLKKPVFIPMILAEFCILVVAGLLFVAKEYGGSADPGDQQVRKALLLFAIVWTTFLIALIVIAVSFSSFNHRQFPQRMKNWQTYWMCRLCGTSFIPSTPTAAPAKKESGG